MEAELVELEHYMQGSSGSPEGSNLQSAGSRESRRNQVGPSSTGKSRPLSPGPSVSPMRASSRKKRRMHLFMRTLSA